MACSRGLLLGLLGLLLGTALAATGVTNTDVKRTIDATGFVVRVAVDASFEAEQGITTYSIALPAAQAEHVAFVGAVMDDVELAVAAASAGDAEAGFVLYDVALGGKTKAATLEIDIVLTQVLQPFPTHISQNENQLVVLEESHYWPSPYPTTTQSTTVKLGTSVVESWTKKKPSSLKSTNIKLGAYADVAAYETSELRVHYENNAPFALVTRATKEVEISLWGNVAIEEMYALEHAGAKLEGGFSRLDYQMRRQQTGPSYRLLTAVLPEQASDVYYRDQIGNISSSALRYDRASEGQLLELLPRFPLFGGWATSWYQGWNVPVDTMLSRSGDRLQLTSTFGLSLENAPVQDYTAKVILPERAANIEVEVPVAVEETMSQRFTYLDVHGRPVVVLRKTNMVAEHDVPFTVSFDLPSPFVEPIMLAAAWFAFFVVCMLAVRVQLSLHPSSVAGEAKPKVE